MSTAIHITSVKRGKNHNWLVFNAYIGYLSPHTLYPFEFCGTEICSLSLSNTAINDLCEQWRSDFGYLPYNIRQCKKIIENKVKEYIIKL